MPRMRVPLAVRPVRSGLCCSSTGVLMRFLPPVACEVAAETDPESCRCIRTCGIVPSCRGHHRRWALTNLVQMFAR